MGPALGYDLRYSGVFDADFFTQQGILFLVPVVLRSESYPRIDTISGPGTRVYDGIVD